MKNILIIFSSILVVLGLTGAASAADGPGIFKDNKCNKCHSVNSAGIGSLKKAVASEEEDDEEEGGGSVKPPDLSNTGSYHDREFYQCWLKKKCYHPAHDGSGEGTKKHKKKFKGSDEEFKTLIDWLLSLKTKA